MADVADQIRRSQGQVELIDDRGNRVGVVRCPPTDDEIEYAKSRVGSAGPKFTVDEVIAKVRGAVNYEVVLSLEALEDAVRITIAAQVVNVSKQIQEALRSDPTAAREHLSEGLYFIDREPLRAFFTIDVADLLVEIVNVKLL